METPPMVAVESSMMTAAGYDGDRRELWIRFASGEGYVYSGVPESVFQELLGAESKGRYFAAEIRPVFATYRRLGREPDWI